MCIKKITFFTFKIKSTFDECSKIFEGKETDIRHSEFGIKAIFRGFSKNDPKKLIYIHQVPEDNIQKIVQANSKWIKSHKVNFLTMEQLS